MGELKHTYNKKHWLRNYFSIAVMAFELFSSVARRVRLTIIAVNLYELGRSNIYCFHDFFHPRPQQIFSFPSFQSRLGFCSPT